MRRKLEALMQRPCQGHGRERSGASASDVGGVVKDSTAGSFLFRCFRTPDIEAQTLAMDRFTASGGREFMIGILKLIAALRHCIVTRREDRAARRP